MPELLTLIKENVQWVFSGIGNSFVGAVLRLFRPGATSTEVAGAQVDSRFSTGQKGESSNRFFEGREIEVGDYAEFEVEHRRIRVEAVAIREVVVRHFFIRSDGEEEFVAELKVDGASVFAGEEIQRVGVDSFLVPKVRRRHEPVRSLFTFRNTDRESEFLRLCVSHINAPAQKIEINVAATASRE